MTTGLTWHETTVSARGGREDGHPMSAGTGGADALWVAQALRGDAQAFGRLYEAHADGVYHFVLFRVQDEALAEDLTHDVWLKALDHIGDLSAPEKVRSWLLSIAHRTVLNHWRGQASRPLPAERLVTGYVDAKAESVAVDDESLAAVADRLDAAVVLAAADMLTDLQRQVIGLRFVAGLSLAETAEAMDRSVTAVKNLQHHALAALRRELDTVAGEP